MIRKYICLLAAAFALLAASASAQFSAYGDVTLEHLTGLQSSPLLNTLSPPPCVGTSTTNCTQYRSAIDPIGFTGGVSYDFKTIGPVRLGADARAIVVRNNSGAQLNANGSGTRIYSFLGGVKGTFHTRYSFVSPYVEAAVGYGRSNFGILTNVQSNGTNYPSAASYPGVRTSGGIEYHGFAGVDLHALPILDWRVVELGYGVLQATGTASHAYPLASISTGFVIHFSPQQ